MSQGIVSADGKRFIFPNGYSRQFPLGPQGCVTWCIEPSGKIWPKCQYGCQCTYTQTGSTCDYCKEPEKVAELPSWGVVIPVDEQEVR